MKPVPELRKKRRTRRRPRVLICTPEITELPEGMGNAAHFIRAKGGGLGDISAGLIRYLYEDERFELHVALPKYDNQIRGFTMIGHRELDVLAPLLDRHGIHLVADSAFSNLNDLYEEQWTHPRVHRAVAFQRHIINHLLDFIEPDVVHCNDWMTGLVPPAAAVRDMKSLFTLHNVFTEKETPMNIDRNGIDVRRLLGKLYFEQYPDESASNWAYNRIDFAASGIYGADRVNTVSKTFLEEIVSGEFKAIIPPSIYQTVVEKYRAGHAVGILNAPNDSVDPRVSSHITPYDYHDVMEKKAVNKQVFQERMGLAQDPEAPLFFWPSRLYSQKGPALLQEIIRSSVEEQGIQVALVANGDAKVEDFFQDLSRECKGRVARKSFAEDLSELGKSGADYVLMPSLYEPCGLPQMECPRFGTLPVGRLTGGIKDTVRELDPEKGVGNGFVFQEFTAQAFLQAMERAVSFHRLPQEVKKANIQRVMKESFNTFTLENTAKDYIRIYETLIAEKDGKEA